MPKDEKMTVKDNYMFTVQLFLVFIISFLLSSLLQWLSVSVTDHLKNLSKRQYL